MHLRSPEVRRLLTGSGTASRRRRLPLGAGLVTVQVALALLLGVGAGLGLRSHRALASEDPGFDLERLAILSISLPSARYETPESQAAFWRRASAALEAVPGVEGVTTSAVPPFSYSSYPGEPTVAGIEAPPPLGEYSATASAAEDFFEVMGIPVLEGRGEPVGPVEPGTLIREIVVNRAFAERYPESVVGRELKFEGAPETVPIVGVVGDVRANGLDDGRRRTQYYFLDSGPSGRYARFILRAARDPAEILAAARARIAEVDPLLLPASASTGPEILRAQTADRRFLSLLLGAFGALALLVASLGVYGAVSLAVSRQKRETGVRVALGAGGSRVVRHVLSIGLRPVALGLVIGALAARVLARYVETALYEIEPADPLSFAAAVAVLSLSGLVACLLPARRAVLVDPVRTLRSE